MTKRQMIKNGMKYQFKNEVQDDKYILTLSGVVAKPDLFDMIFGTETINAQDVKEALDDVEQDILIRINSGGGDAFEGIEIYNYLRNHPSHITVEVTALAASAASLITMAGDKVIMDTGSSMMIHEASTIAWGNKTELKKALNALETMDGSIVDIYADRTGISANELNTLIESETWMTADEAVQKGFADEKSSRRAVTPSTESEPDESDTGYVNMKITDMEEFKTMMSDMQKEISAMKNNNASQKQEPKKRLYF